MSSASVNNNKGKRIVLKTLWITLITIKWMIIMAIIGGFFGAGIVFGYVSALVKDDPVRSAQLIDEKMNENAITGFVYFNDDNTQVGQLRTDEDRRLAKIEEIPDLVKNAFVAIEDNNFYNHPGVDLRALVRAAKQKLLKQDVQTGGSTITQQLARRVFLSLDKTDSRKVKEIFLALRLERQMTKPEIITAYLNKIPFGNGSNGYNLYGIKAAAKGIFDKSDLNQLNVAQAAYLAGLPQSPSTYSAFTSKGKFDEKGFNLAHSRQQLVLKRMLEENKITDAQYQEALAFDIQGSLAQTREKEYATYPYLMLEAERQATEILLLRQNPELKLEDLRKKEYSEAVEDAREHLLRGGYKIYTTIDKQIYDTMHVISSNPDNFSPDDKVKGVEEIAAVMLDNKTGAVLGMIEGRDFYREQMNHATQMLRQPGSTMKPVAAYGPAMELGKIQPGGIIDDIPIMLKDGQKGIHIPFNWDNKFHGLMTARRALNQSYNIPAIKLFVDEVGIKTAWEYARKMGITSLTKEDEQASTGVIGGLTKGVSVQELTGAYTTFANGGMFKETYFIRKIEDANGNIIYSHDEQPMRVFSEETAYLMTDMMRTVLTEGTGTNVRKKFKHYGKIPVVGKTGSTQDDFDAWFMGYSPDITMGVWAGYDTPATLSKGNGTMRAMNIWSLVMDAVADLKPELFTTDKFEKPKNIVSATVSSVSGKLPSDLVKQNNLLVTDLFNRAWLPKEVDDILGKANVIHYDGKAYLPQPSTPSDMYEEKLVVKREKPLGELLKEIEAAQQKVSPKYRKTINYSPSIAVDDAPTEMDPRTDDGAAPTPPGSLKVALNGDTIEATFAPSGSNDVVGYRIFRSVDNAPFEYTEGRVVPLGADNKFTDKAAKGHLYGYYLVAVDVAGKVSEPSAPAYLDQGSGMSPDIHGSGDQPDPIEPNVPGGDTSSTGPVPETPRGVHIDSGGIGIVMTWSEGRSEDQITHYNVYYSSTEQGPFKKIGSPDKTRFEYISIPIDGWYRVTAVNANGESPQSGSVAYKETTDSQQQ